jgi:uncharacterized repeat protein (TIGR02543 family)
MNGTGIGFNASTTLTGDITVYAQWIARSYTLSFNANGGDSRIPDAQTVFFGQLAQPVLSPIDADQAFLGWNTSADGSGIQWDFGRTTMPARDIMLYAQWSEPEVAPPPIIIPPAPPIIVRVVEESVEPEPEPVVEIEPTEPPLVFLPETDPPAATAPQGSWSLLNLLLTILCLAFMIFAAISAATKRYDDKGVRRKRKIGFAGTVILAVANVALFLGTQSILTASMVWGDEYTVASALITLISAVATWFAFLKRSYDIEEVE